LKNNLLKIRDAFEKKVVKDGSFVSLFVTLRGRIVTVRNGSLPPGTAKTSRQEGTRMTEKKPDADEKTDTPAELPDQALDKVSGGVRPIARPQPNEPLMPDRTHSEPAFHRPE
jgi:hypothetical protein